MKSLKHYTDHMDQLLVDLVEVATELRDMSLKVISEEELAPLQKHQEHLLAELGLVDQKIQKNYPQQVDTALRNKVHHQLQAFQRLNREFIQNLNTSHGPHQFELRRIKKGEEGNYSHVGLNKISPPPDSTKTIKSKENKQS